MPSLEIAYERSRVNEKMAWNVISNAPSALMWAEQFKGIVIYSFPFHGTRRPSISADKFEYAAISRNALQDS